jgi:hypothetical protein
MALPELANRLIDNPIARKVLRIIQGVALVAIADIALATPANAGEAPQPPSEVSRPDQRLKEYRKKVLGSAKGFTPKAYEHDWKAYGDTWNFELKLFLRNGKARYIQYGGSQGANLYKEDRKKVIDALLRNIHLSHRRNIGGLVGAMELSESVRAELRRHDDLSHMDYRGQLKSHIATAQHYLEEIERFKRIVPLRHRKNYETRIKCYCNYILAVEMMAKATVDFMFIDRWQPGDVDRKVDFAKARKAYLEALEEIVKLGKAMEQQQRPEIRSRLTSYLEKYRHATGLFEADLRTLMRQAELKIARNLPKSLWVQIVYTGKDGKQHEVGSTSQFKRQWEGHKNEPSVYDLVGRVATIRKRAQGLLKNDFAEPEWLSMVKGAVQLKEKDLYLNYEKIAKKGSAGRKRARTFVGQDVPHANSKGYYDFVYSTHNANVMHVNDGQWYRTSLNKGTPEGIILIRKEENRCDAYVFLDQDWAGDVNIFHCGNFRDQKTWRTSRFVGRQVHGLSVYRVEGVDWFKSKPVRGGLVVGNMDSKTLKKLIDGEEADASYIYIQ